MKQQLVKDANVSGWEAILIGIAFLGLGIVILLRRDSFASLQRRLYVMIMGKERTTALGGAPGSAQERRGVLFIGGLVVLFGAGWLAAAVFG